MKSSCHKDGRSFVYLLNKNERQQVSCSGDCGTSSHCGGTKGTVALLLEVYLGLKDFLKMIGDPYVWIPDERRLG